MSPRYPSSLPTPIIGGRLPRRRLRRRGAPTRACDPDQHGNWNGSATHTPPAPAAPPCCSSPSDPCSHPRRPLLAPRGRPPRLLPARLPRRPLAAWYCPLLLLLLIAATPAASQSPRRTLPSTSASRPRPHRHPCNPGSRRADRSTAALANTAPGPPRGRARSRSGTGPPRPGDSSTRLPTATSPSLRCGPPPIVAPLRGRRGVPTTGIRRRLGPPIGGVASVPRARHVMHELGVRRPPASHPGRSWGRRQRDSCHANRSRIGRNVRWRGTTRRWQGTASCAVVLFLPRCILYRVL